MRGRTRAPGVAWVSATILRPSPSVWSVLGSAPGAGFLTPSIFCTCLARASTQAFARAAASSGLDARAAIAIRTVSSSWLTVMWPINAPGVVGRSVPFRAPLAMTSSATSVVVATDTYDVTRFLASWSPIVASAAPWVFPTVSRPVALAW